MGKLRKIGRKIKRQVKKLFSSKIGRFLGTIALMYLVPMAADKLFTGFGNLFQGKTWAGAARAGQTVSTVSTAGSTVGAGAGDVVVGDLIGGGTATGGGGTLTGAGSELYTGLEPVLKNIATDPESSSRIANWFTDFKEKTGTFFGKQGYEGSGLDRGVSYVTGDEFVPELAKGALTATATSALMGQPEEPFYSKGIQPYMGEALSTAAKENYIADISPSFRNLTGQTPTSIGQVKNAGFYGPNDPNFFGQLAMIPTIPLPRIT